MLLSMMRRHAQSWLIKFLVAIIAAVFIFYFGYSFHTSTGIKVAEVNGEVITGAEYQKTYRSMLEALQREYKSVWSDSLVKAFNVKNRALESLINQKVVSQEAKRIGFEVTKKEVQDQIVAQPAFQSRGRFDETRYRTLLLNYRMKPEEYEADVERGLLQRKLEQFLGIFVAITDQDVLDYYAFSNEKVKIGFVQYSPDRFMDGVKVDEAALEKYFQEHKENYRIPEKLKAAYVVYDPAEFMDKTRATDQQIKDTYDEKIDLFREKRQVKVRHVLFKLAQDASEEDEKKVKEKALPVLKKARSGEDFAGLAKKYSEDPSGEGGGDLGYFSAGEMLKPVEEAAFKMKKGEISDLVRSPLGYHILKLEDIKEARTKSLDEARDKIAELLASTAASDMAHEKAFSLLDQMPYQTDLTKFAAEHQKTAESTEYFSLDEPIPVIGGSEKLRQSLFSLQKGDVSEVFDVEGKFYIFQVTDRKPSILPALVDVRQKVTEDLRAELASKEAKAAAERFLLKAKGGEDWAGLSKKNGLPPQTTDFFSRQSPAPELGYDGDLVEEAFSLSEKRRYPDRVFENERGVFVIRYEAGEGIDKGKYQEEKEKYRQSLFQARHRVLLGNWLADLRKRAEIEIHIPADKEGPEL
ncbi:MAG: SurA N-terminal domain-containing protein [Deltaproteobacteria bacterium]|nr:SurA N-terminal domain-containing protein [Deltaproteobacteria bacterium]